MSEQTSLIPVVAGAEPYERVADYLLGYVVYSVRSRRGIAKDRKVSAADRRHLARQIRLVLQDADRLLCAEAPSPNPDAAAA